MKKNSYTVDVLDINGRKTEKLELDSAVFDGIVNRELLHQVIVAYLANQRKGTASTKTRGEISGGGKKPWRQKGTGRARVGSSRSPLWRGGGTVFGPRPRGYSVKISGRMKVQALKSSLNSKLTDGELVVVEDFDIEQPKTKNFLKILSSLGLNKDKTLVVCKEVSGNMRLSCRNLSRSFVLDYKSVTAYDVLNYKKLVLVKSALSELAKRIKRK
ncbi:MAG: 50S ribosomal protein L4 [Candidatus Omnitrophica bacterium]|nr:50S ribosomal protein L4 [Candidatus Omnitrophota bacterium]